MSEASSTNRTSCRRLSGDRFRMEWTERRRTDLRHVDINIYVQLYI